MTWRARAVFGSACAGAWMVWAPDASATTTCEDYVVPAPYTLNCTNQRIQGATVGLFSHHSQMLDDYTRCTNSSTLQTGHERFLEFTCDSPSVVTAELRALDCDVDLFVLDDTCDGSNVCLASNTDAWLRFGPQSFLTNSFLCLPGRTYYVVAEFAEEIFTNPATRCPIVQVQSPPSAATGSRYTVEMRCSEDCDDGFDNDGNGQFDCDDVACFGEPVCSAGPEDCDVPGDEDLNGLADCADPACIGTEACCDLDEDGFWSTDPDCGGDDCDDDDRFVHPGADEVPNDGVDQDCDGQDACWLDEDMDGFGGDLLIDDPTFDCTDGAMEADVDGDCDDDDEFIHPDATEVPGDGVDQDCDTFELCYRDQDGDGVGGPTTFASLLWDCGIVPGGSRFTGDCDDLDGAVYPGAQEAVGDQFDQNCDGNELCYRDGDRDGYGVNTGATVVSVGNVACNRLDGESTNADDCDDTQASVRPGATEIPYDGIDQDCVGGDLTDLDGDGAPGGPGGTDCDDANPAVRPGATERPVDGVDQDCDGRELCYRDQDLDSFGGSLTLLGDDMDCTGPPGEADNDDDCDDLSASVNPDGVEVPYDGIDQDCAGGDLVDVDGDGSRGGPAGADCNDLDADVRPGAVEQPNGADDDCDGVVDEGTVWYDDDGDGYAEAGGDCDDTRAAVHPGAPELVNQRDDDCDDVADEGTIAFDDDGDGFCESVGVACTDGSSQGDCNDGDPATYPGAPEPQGSGADRNCDGRLAGSDNDRDGYTVRAGDCNDANAAISPAAREIPNGVDDDCDEAIDEGTELSDDDGDGYCESTTAPCREGALNGDCDDTSFARSPGVLEDRTNHIDDDCDGVIDEGGVFTDDDGDGLSEDAGDCDDADPTRSPLVAETANGRDDDCDGAIDEGADDADGDGWTATAGDCDDADGWSNPEAIEVCDRVDNDCDGQVDEDGACDAGVVVTTPEDTGSGCSASGRFGGAWWLVLPALLGGRRRR